MREYRKPVVRRTSPCRRRLRASATAPSSIHASVCAGTEPSHGRGQTTDTKIAWNGGASQGQHEQQSPLANSTRATSWLALLLALDASSARLQGESPGAVSVAFGSMAFARRSESTCIKSTRDLPREGPRAAAETRIECRLTCAPYVRNLSAAGGGACRLRGGHVDVVVRGSRLRLWRAGVMHALTTSCPSGHRWIQCSPTHCNGCFMTRGELSRGSV